MRCWPLTILPGAMTPTMLAEMVQRIDELLEREQIRGRENTDG